MDRELAMKILVGCIVLDSYFILISTLDSARTNRELREMANDTRRANGYLVRAAAQRKHFWQR